MLKSQKNSNITITYILAFASDLFFPIAVWLFFYSQYLDFKEIALMTAIGGLAGMILEVPTGAFADMYGRKLSLVLSYFLFAISMVAVAFSTSFIAFACLAVVAALVNALYSGSMEALVYDSLKETGNEDQFDHVISRLEAITWVGLFVGSVIGGFLYTLNFRLPFLAQAVLTIIAAVAALKLKEPKIDSVHYKLSDFATKNIQGFKELFHSIKTTRISLTFITIESGYAIAAAILGISQAQEYGIKPEMVGILFGIGYILSAAASYLYPQFRKIAGMKILLILSVTALLSSFLFAQYVGIVVGSLLIIMRIASSTTFRNTRSIIMNRMFTSQNRATAISTLTLLSSLPYTILAYFIGDYIDKTSPNQFAFTLGIILIFVLTIVQFLSLFEKKPVKV